MNWVLVIGVAWLLLAPVAALLIGRAIARADRNVSQSDATRTDVVVELPVRPGDGVFEPPEPWLS